jgi:hypothetical protein
MNSFRILRAFILIGAAAAVTGCGPFPVYQNSLSAIGEPQTSKTQARIVCNQVANEAERKMELQIARERDANASYQTSCYESYGEVQCETQKKASSGGFSAGMREARRIHNAGDSAMSACLADKGYVVRRTCVANCR